MFNLNNLIRLGGNLYITDFLDMIIMALVIYSLFTFLKSTRSYRIFFGLAITTGLYLIARTFNLYLTYLTLRYFVGVAVIIFVIIFQSEIRKYFEFLGFIGTRRIKVGRIAPRSPYAADIIQACVKMAQEKIGALIVIQGKDHLDSITEGGTPLDGVISEEVLLSIFDASSDGHDGAVIISNNRIARFGAHLPLSTNFKELGKHGTRHSAALGLSENSDALAIVVSEEKGKISIATDGKLKKLTQFTDLEKELNKYIRHKFGTGKNGSMLDVFRRNLWYKFGAVSSAVLIWFFTAYQAGIMEKSYAVPVTLDRVPPNVLIENYSPKEVKITVSGRGEQTFSNISGDAFKVNFDATTLKSGVNKESISKKNIVIPANLTLVKFEPDSVLLTTTKYTSVQVPVAAKITGTADKNLEVKSIVSSPEAIELWIPEGENPPNEIATETIDISNLTESVISPIKIVIPEGTRLVREGDTVNIAITIEEKETP